VSTHLSYRPPPFETNYLYCDPFIALRKLSKQ
jgi:hypothetical protein